MQFRFDFEGSSADRTFLAGLPRLPGVYFLRDDADHILYIGKAKDLRRRVGSYFAVKSGGKDGKSAAESGRRRRLLREIRSVACRRTGTELEALLLESRLIKCVRPRYNRALLHPRGGLWLSIDPEDAAPRLAAVAIPPEGSARSFGPFPGASLAVPAARILSRLFRLRTCDDRRFPLGRECVAAELGHCPAPCTGGTDDDYRRRVGQLLDFLEGNDRTIIDRITERMLQASAKLRFERAAVLREEIRVLSRIYERAWSSALIPSNHRELLLLPGFEEGWIEAHVIRGGLHAGARILDPADDHTARIEELFGEAEQRPIPDPESFGDAEKEELRILRGWIGRYRGLLLRIPWSEGVHPFAAAKTAARILSVMTGMEPPETGYVPEPGWTEGEAAEIMPPPLYFPVFEDPGFLDFSSVPS